MANGRSSDTYVVSDARDLETDAVAAAEKARQRLEDARQGLATLQQMLTRIGEVTASLKPLADRLSDMTLSGAGEVVRAGAPGRAFLSLIMQLGRDRLPERHRPSPAGELRAAVGRLAPARHQPGRTRQLAGRADHARAADPERRRHAPAPRPPPPSPPNPRSPRPTAGWPASGPPPPAAPPAPRTSRIRAKEEPGRSRAAESRRALALPSPSRRANSSAAP